MFGLPQIKIVTFGALGYLQSYFPKSTKSWYQCKLAGWSITEYPLGHPQRVGDLGRRLRWTTDARTERA